MVHSKMHYLNVSLTCVLEWLVTVSCCLRDDENARSSLYLNLIILSKYYVKVCSNFILHLTHYVKVPLTL